MPRALLLALLVVGCATAQATTTADAAVPAKHFSMKGYQMAILRKGPKRSGANTPEIAKLLQPPRSSPGTARPASPTTAARKSRPRTAPRALRVRKLAVDV
jgi:hypothetical protein